MIAGHRICPYCGYYKSEKTLDIISKKEKNKSKEKNK
jgi:hypothetical protein